MMNVKMRLNMPQHEAKNQQTSPARRAGLLPLALLLLAPLALAMQVRASIDGTTPADQTADIDWPMYDDPFLADIPIINVHDARLKDIWRAALGRPDVETRRRAAYEIGIAAQRGMPDLADLAGSLVEQMDAPDAHPAMILAAAQALIVLDAKQAAGRFLKHNERGAASGVIRGGSIPTSDPATAANGGIEFVLLTDPALAKWNHEPAKSVWMKRIADSATSPRVRISAIDALRTIKHLPSVDPLKQLAIDRAFEPQSMRLHAARALASLVDSDLEAHASPLVAGALVDRLVAVTLLSRHQGDAAVAMLLKLAADVEPAVATIALERLLEIDPALINPLAETLLRNGDARVRLQAARAVAVGRSPAAIAALAPILDDLSPQVRGFVRDRFIEFDKDASLSPLIRAEASRLLAGASWRSMEQAAVILGRVDHDAAGPRLVALLPHPRGEVRMAAIIALRRIAVEDEPLLAAITAHTDREADAWLLSVKRATEQSHLPFVLSAQRDRELAQLLQLLGKLRHQPAQKVMERFVPKKSGFWTESRAAAVWAIGLLHEDKPDERLAKEFVGRLSDLDPNNPELMGVRRMAAISIGRMKATSGVKGLQVFYEMERSSRHIGGACRWSLIRITGKELPPLGPRESTASGWFIQPLEAPPVKK